MLPQPIIPLIARVIVMCATLLCAMTPSVWAALEEEELVGEVRFTTNSDYARASVNGSAWEDVEYENKGRRIVVKNLDLTRESYDITLTPGYDTLGPLTVTIAAKEFRRERKGRVVYMVVKKKVKFPVAKKKPEEKRPPSPEKAPEPVPDDDL